MCINLKYYIGSDKIHYQQYRNIKKENERFGRKLPALMNNGQSS